MRYHQSLGFPKTLKFPDKFVLLQYTKHAKKKKKDYNEMKEWPRYIGVKKEFIIEVETKDNKKCDKILMRRRWDDKKDIILVLEVKKYKARVVTLWLNNNGDQHATMDKSIYDIPDPNNSAEIDFIYGGKN